MLDFSSFVFGVCIGLIGGIIVEKIITFNRFKKIEELEETPKDPTKEKEES